MATVRRSLLLSLADSYLALALQLIGTVVIARVISPAETGVFAVAAVAAAVASTFRDFGIAEYLIQEKDLTHQRIRAALALNIAVSWLIAALLILFSSSAGHFYGHHGVRDVMRVQALVFFIVPFGAVTQAWFRRELNYRPLALCGAASNVTSFGVSVTMALLGFSYMSLAWASVASVAVTVGMTVWFRPAGFPMLPSLAGIRRVFDFGKYATSIYLIAQVGKGAPELILGKIQSMADAGLFSRANGLVEIFNRMVMRSVMQVCMPYFARAEREHGSVKGAYLRSVSYLTAVGWPFMAALAVAAFAAIRLIYGPQWTTAVPVAQLLCLACALELTHALSREALLACGAARQSAFLQVVIVLLQIGGLAAGAPLGLEGAGWGLVAASALGVLAAQWQLTRTIGLSFFELAHHCLPSLYVAALTVAPIAVWAVMEGVSETNYLRFGLIGGVVTAVAWLAAIRLLRHPFADEIATLIQGSFSKLRGFS